MNAEEFVSLLDGVRQTSRGWNACCPAHDDSNPSLSISIGHSQCILIHCFSGCLPQEICDALGIHLRDLFIAQKGDPRVREKQRGREHERMRKRQQWRVKGFQTDVMREAESLINAARSIDISGWSFNRLNQELERLARAYVALEKEWRNEY